MASSGYTFWQWSCYGTFINYVVNLTVSFYWAFCFFSAIEFWSLVTWFRCDIFIKFLDDFWHIVHATEADFNCIAVENFVKLVASREKLCYQLKECLCNICWNGFAKRWVKPCYVSLSRFWFFWFVVGVFQIIIIIRLPWCIFLFDFCCIKNFLVGRIFWKSLKDGIWSLFDNLC